MIASTTSKLIAILGFSDCILLVQKKTMNVDEGCTCSCDDLVIIQSKEDVDEEEECEPDYKCPICIELLKFPVSLQCGHTMCLECGEKLDKKICPICRCPIRGLLKKNVVMDALMAKMFGDVYKKKCDERKYIKIYKKSCRYAILHDLIYDTMSMGDMENELVYLQGFFYDKERLIKRVYKDINAMMEKRKYYMVEIRFMIGNMVWDRELIEVRGLIMINETDSILETISDYKEYLDSETLLECLASALDDYIDEYPEIGAEVHKRRKKNVCSLKSDMMENEQIISEMIRNNKFGI